MLSCIYGLDLVFVSAYKKPLVLLFMRGSGLHLPDSTLENMLYEKFFAFVYYLSLLTINFA